MPCNSDYLSPNKRERTSVAVLGFLQECNLAGTATGGYDRNYGNVAALSKDVAKLCAFLKTRTPRWIKDHTSLELQIFWRDHQEADRNREKMEKAAHRKKMLQERAIRKLTPAEREALRGESR